MAITTTPLYTPNSASAPNIFVLSKASANPLVRAFVTATVNGTTYNAIPIPVRNEAPAGTYNFEIDVQELLRANVAPFENAKTPVFGALNLPYLQQIPEEVAEYSISATYSYIDPATGYLTDLGSTDTSGTFYAITATRQRYEAQDFTDYKPQSGSPNTKKWLTNSPTTQDISNNENVFLTHIKDSAADACRVRTYTAAGALIDSGYFFIDTDVLEVEPQSIGVGIANLAAQVYDSGAVTLPNAAAAYYEIQLFNSAIAFIDFIQPRRFNIVAACLDSIRLHWLNLLGGADSHTFKVLSKRVLQNEYTKAQKTLSGVYNFEDKGSFKNYSTGVQQYTVETAPLSVDMADWLKELALSREVYLETANGLQPILITNTETSIEKDVTGELSLESLTFTFIDANSFIVP